MTRLPPRRVTPRSPLDGEAGPRARLGLRQRLAGFGVTAILSATLVGLVGGAPAAGAAGGVAAVAVSTSLLGPIGGAISAVSGVMAARLGLGWSWPEVAALAAAGAAGILGVSLAHRRLIQARRAAADAADRAVALERTERRFRGLLEGAPDAIVISDAENRILLLNAEAERLFGYPRHELIGRSMDMLMPERFRDRHAAHIRAYFARPTTRRMGDGANMFGRRRDGSEFPIETNLSLLSDRGEGLVTSVIRDLTLRREVQEREALLMRELNHRVKNTLASVQSIVAQTLRSSPTPEAFSAAVQARVAALSQSHDVLTRNDWAGATVKEVVDEQLSPYAGEGAPFRLEGSEVMLRPNRAVTLGMVVGELATNAAKFGALSAGGSVAVQWSVFSTPGGPRLRLVWCERGGPPVKAPAQEGFGTRLVKRSLAAGLQGTAELDYAEAGLTVVLEFPLAEGEA